MHPVTWQNTDTLDALRGRFIQLRLYGSEGLVFGVGINEPGA